MRAGCERVPVGEAVCHERAANEPADKEKPPESLSVPVRNRYSYLYN